MNNKAFFEYLDWLIKEDKLEYAFLQVEYFLQHFDKRDRADETDTLKEARTAFTLLENRFSRWRTNRNNIDSRDSRLEITQIVNGFLSASASLHSLPNIDYNAYLDIPEPLADDAPIEVNIKPRGRMMWWIALGLSILSAIGVWYLIFRKEPYRHVEPPAPAPKALTLILHEVGDRTNTSLIGQGRLSIRDLEAHGIANDIDNQGIVHFKDMPLWAFESKRFLILDIRGVDESLYRYRLLDSLYDSFIPNDTIFIPFYKETVNVVATIEPNFSAQKYLDLVFFSEKEKKKKPFVFDPNKTVKELKEYIIDQYVKKEDLRYASGTLLTYGAARTPLTDESKSLAITKIKNQEIFYLTIISTVNARSKANNDVVQIKVIGKTSNEVKVKINNEPVEAKQEAEQVSLKVPIKKEEKIMISVEDGNDYYQHIIEPSQLREHTIDMKNMRHFNTRKVIDLTIQQNMLKNKAW